MTHTCKKLGDSSTTAAKCYGCQQVQLEKARKYHRTEKGKLTRQAANRKWRAKAKAENRHTYLYRKMLLKKYGLTPESYVAMYTPQKGECAICKKSYATLYVDHDHDTGTVRGLLCNKCNCGIGFLNDSPSVVMAAYSYLTDIR